MTIKGFDQNALQSSCCFVNPIAGRSRKLDQPLGGLVNVHQHHPSRLGDHDDKNPNHQVDNLVEHGKHFTGTAFPFWRKVVNIRANSPFIFFFGLLSYPPCLARSLVNTKGEVDGDRLGVGVILFIAEQ